MKVQFHYLILASKSIEILTCRVVRIYIYSCLWIAVVISQIIFYMFMYCHTSIDSMNMNIRPNYYLFSPKLAFSLFVVIVIQFMSKVKRNVENLDT